jgi:hypothetical protein
MQASCPRCGGWMNGYVKDGDTFGAQSPKRLQTEHLRYECLDCGWISFKPPMVHEDRIEWFFDVVVWRLTGVLACLFVLAFLLQVLGIL